MAAREAEAHEREVRSLGRSVWLATLLSLPVFVLEMGAHFMPGIYELVAATIGQEGSWYLQFALATIVLFGPGLRFFQRSEEHTSEPQSLMRTSYAVFSL